MRRTKYPPPAAVARPADTEAVHSALTIDNVERSCRPRSAAPDRNCAVWNTAVAPRTRCARSDDAAAMRSSPAKSAAVIASGATRGATTSRRYLSRLDYLGPTFVRTFGKKTEGNISAVAVAADIVM